MNENWIVTSEGIRINAAQIAAYYWDIRYGYLRVFTPFSGGSINISETAEEFDYLMETYSARKCKINV